MSHSQSQPAQPQPTEVHSQTVQQQPTELQSQTVQQKPTNPSIQMVPQHSTTQVTPQPMQTAQMIMLAGIHGGGNKKDIAGVMQQL